MRILYLTQWFEPEPAYKGLGFAKALAARGHHVEVVTGFPNYPTGKLYPGYRISLHRREEIDGIIVHRVALFPSHGDSSVGRILNYLSFSATSAIFTLFNSHRFDVVYAYSPVTIGLGAVLGTLFSRRPVVTEVQDLWPDSVLKSGMRGTKYMRPILNAICGFVYRRCAKIVSQSNGIRNLLIERSVPAEKVSIIYNWADEEDAAPRGLCDLAPYAFEGRFNIVYGGNFGRVQGLDTLIRAAVLAGREAPELHLLLIGGGVEKANLEALVRALDASNVTIAPGVPRAMIGDIFAAADVLALHLHDDPLFAITIPSKVQFYMAMGKPVLIGVKGEAADLVTRAGAGIAVPPQNVDAMAVALVKFARLHPDERLQMGEKARDAYWRRFSHEVAITATDAEIHSLLTVKE